MRLKNKIKIILEVGLYRVFDLVANFYTLAWIYDSQLKSWVGERGFGIRLSPVSALGSSAGSLI